MSKTKLDLFEESGIEVYEVTKGEWIEIYRDHMKHWYNLQSDITEVPQKILENDKVESECFHHQAVRMALEKDITVDPIILIDYPGLIEQVNKKKEYELNRPRLTQEIFDSININDKIMLNNSKVTVYKKEENNLIVKPYRSKTKGIVVSIGIPVIVKMGWC